MLPVEVCNLIEEFCNRRVPILDMQRRQPYAKFGDRFGMFPYGGPHKWESWSIREGLWKANKSEEEYWELFKDYFNYCTNEWSIDHPIFTETNMYTALSIL